MSTKILKIFSIVAFAIVAVGGLVLLLFVKEPLGGIIALVIGLVGIAVSLFLKTKKKKPIPEETAMFVKQPRSFHPGQAAATAAAAAAVAASAVSAVKSEKVSPSETQTPQNDELADLSSQIEKAKRELAALQGQLANAQGTEAQEVKQVRQVRPVQQVQPDEFDDEEPEAKKPIFKQWWFWVIVGVLVIAIVGAVIGILLKGRTSSTVPEPSPTMEPAATETPEPTEEPVEPTEEPMEIVDIVDEPGDAEAPPTSEGDDAEQSAASPTLGEENALNSAKSYLEVSPFSWSGMVDQLEFEGYTHEEAVYGADNCDADWFEQAAKSAQRYLELMSFSREGLIEQLEYEGFTNEEAVYGAEQNGY